jgi:uncharacterized protein (TIGR03086 family)
MAATSDRIYLEGLDVFSAVVERHPSDGWYRPTPCSAWSALDVLGHVGATTRFGIDLLGGGAPAWQPSERPGDAVEGDPARWWRALAEQARELVGEADLSREIDTPFGRRSVAEGLTFPAIDLFVHAWDLARSGGTTVDIPEHVVEFTHAKTDGFPREQMRSPGVFDVEQPVPAGATPTEVFVAWTGRNPRWQVS